MDKLKYMRLHNTTINVCFANLYLGFTEKHKTFIFHLFLG
jgi:hypothetical protein